MLICSIPYSDPLALFALFERDAHAVLLDGAGADKKSRMSYIAVNPFSIIECIDDCVMVDGKKTQFDPFTILEWELGKYATEAIEAPASFVGGAVGYLGYELGGWLERLPKAGRNELNLPSMVIGIYDVILAFDNNARKAWVFSHGWPEAAPAKREERARKRAEALIEKIAQAPKILPALNWNARAAWSPELKRADAETRIKKIIDYIHAGDIFQANFTQRFLAARPQGLDDFMLYRRLRALSPAPFAAFLRCGMLAIASASPERFLSLQSDGKTEAHPVKGTRPRDADHRRDRALAQELKNSAKDNAENLMIVDLMRNDLSRVCQPGSVQVPHLCALESFASVHHLTSVVTGTLQAEKGPIDLLRASFPGGSVTGAPKIRAMEIIHELEPAPRGVYCGCLGWIGFDGAMDMGMTIRTITIAGDTILAQAGGGIVADSDPAAEYDESMTKIAPLLRALTGETR